MNVLNEKEKQKRKIIKQIVNKEISKSNAEELLNLCRRQINRLIKKYLEEGDDAFMHKNKGRISDKKISTEIVDKIKNLYIEKYYDYNFTHFYEETSKELGVSFITVCNVLNEADIISPEAQHKTIKLYNEKMKNAIHEKIASEEQIKLFEKRKKHEKEKHYRRSENLYAFGEEVQMDAAVYEWFNNEVTFLHLAVDRGTKKVLYGWFDYQETSNAYYILLMNTIINYGIPSGIRTDKRGSFNVNNLKFQKTKVKLTQFGSICKDLEISLKSSSNPVFKPNVERENKTFKGRLKAELRFNNIKTIEEANEFLNNIFIPKMNDKFSYDINPNKNFMRETTYTTEELNIIISERYERTIDNASSFKFDNSYYMPIDCESGEVISYCSGTKVIVVIAYDKTIFCYINEKLYQTIKLENNKNKESNNCNSNGYKPAKNHPWRGNVK